MDCFYFGLILNTGAILSSWEFRIPPSPPFDSPSTCLRRAEGSLMASHPHALRARLNGVDSHPNKLAGIRVHCNLKETVTVAATLIRHHPTELAQTSIDEPQQARSRWAVRLSAF